MQEKDYEYYRDDMNNGVLPVIKSQSAMEENLLLGRILTWLPRKIIGLFVKKKRESRSECTK